MAKDLRITLGKSQIESKNQGDPHFPWKPGTWEAAMEAYRAGIRVPEPRQFIVISSDSLIDSPEKLQKLADLPSVPEVIETNEAFEFPESTGDTVRVSGLLWDEFTGLRDRTELRQILVWMPHWRKKELHRRAAYIVTSVKEENAISGNADEESSGTQGD
ncbi:hypothetical protein ONZ43_g6652 [Nemania bipapillata]|uniref:Uncharacterized protein n=1 Tax=Nemania bipapillata TaxID=110536 RepID=A0ACC2HXF0_9PEZI|nr:hypothetical protein ONZ43_g6652 [Nemania bipapillata]